MRRWQKQHVSIPRKQAYAHLQQLNLSYFETAKTGDLSHRLTEDIDRVGEVVNKVFQFVPCILQLMVVLGYMVYLNWQLTRRHWYFRR